MSKKLSNKFSLKKNFDYFNKKDKSWVNIFYNSLKKDYILHKNYPNLSKILLGEKQYLEVLNKKIEDFKPDLIFVSIDSDKIHKIVKKYKNIKKIIWISHKVNSQKIFDLKNSYNYLITDNDFLISESKKIKFKFFKMLISSPSILNLNLNFKNFKKRSDKLYFSGSLGNDFKKRLNYLIYLSENFQIKLRIRNLVEKFKILNYLNSFFLKLIPNTANFLYKRKILPLTNKLKYINNDEIFGKDMLDELKNYKFCINIHSDFDQDNSINSRVFEALSCGCLLFTDENKAMKRIFKKNKHVIYFKSKSDLRDKIIYYKKNIGISYKIAKESNDFFIKNHQSKVRIKQFKKILKSIKV